MSYAMKNLQKDSNLLMQLHREMLLNGVIIPSTRENSLVNPNYLHLSDHEFGEMKYITKMSNNLVIKLCNSILKKEIDDVEFKIPAKELLFNDNNEITNLFLARSDVFKRENGGLFIAEINYDKPSGHKETDIESYFNISNNPNANFKEKFLKGFKKNYYNYYGSTNVSPKIAIVCDLYKYEEITLGQYYKNIFAMNGWECDIVGVNNIKIEDDKVTAFNKEYNVIFRKFPIEFHEEFPFIKDLYNLFVNGKMLILNDPKAIIAQNKQIFSLMWDLIESSYFNNKEKEFIRKYIPFTSNLNKYIRKFDTKKDLLQYLYRNKDSWIIKEIFTRYSEGVYVGKTMHPNEWYKIIATAIEMPDKFIIQEFITIKNEPTEFYFTKEDIIPEYQHASRNLKKHIQNYEKNKSKINCYINYGIHIVNGKYAGMCVRMSPTYVTHEDTVFFQPVKIK